MRTTVPPSVIYKSLCFIGANSLNSLENCLPEQTTNIIPLSMSLSMTDMYSGSMSSEPSFTSVPSISVAISFIIIYLPRRISFEYSTISL